MTVFNAMYIMDAGYIHRKDDIILKVNFGVVISFHLIPCRSSSSYQLYVKHKGVNGFAALNTRMMI